MQTLPSTRGTRGGVGGAGEGISGPTGAGSRLGLRPGVGGGVEEMGNGRGVVKESHGAPFEPVEYNLICGGLKGPGPRSTPVLAG